MNHPTLSGTWPHDNGRLQVPAPGEPEHLAGPIAGLLDGAHAELPTRELATLLLALERPAAQLAESGDPDLNAGEAPLALSPPALVRLVLIRGLLGAAAGSADAGRRARLGGWLREYLEEVAARPRGAAVPAT